MIRIAGTALALLLAVQTPAFAHALDEYLLGTIISIDPAGTGFHSMFFLGVQHIAAGTDHLLFLLTLLLPAPLLISSGRWSGRASGRHSLLRIVSTVTAFTIGHSITLALAAVGAVHVHGAPIEVLVAASIFLAAIHAIRPLLNAREAWIAGSFGLVHGLAFASVLDQLGQHGWTLVVSILGFNLGIEAMQLLVVIAAMPCLLLLSRTRWYPPLRIGAALFAATLSMYWIGQRLPLVQMPT